MKDSFKAIPLPGIGSIGAAGKAIRDVKSKVDNSQKQKYRDQSDAVLAPIRGLFDLDKDGSA